MNFWKKVDDELVYKGMSRKELAIKADFDASYIPKGIARNSVPAADLALRIAHALHVTPEYLLDMDGSSSIEAIGNETNIQLLKKYQPLLTEFEKLEDVPRKKLFEFLNALNH